MASMPARATRFLLALRRTVPRRTAWVLSTHRAPITCRCWRRIVARMERGRLVEQGALPRGQPSVVTRTRRSAAARTACASRQAARSAPRAAAACRTRKSVSRRTSCHWYFRLVTVARPALARQRREWLRQVHADRDALWRLVASVGRRAATRRRRRHADRGLEVAASDWYRRNCRPRMRRPAAASRRSWSPDCIPALGSTHCRRHASDRRLATRDQRLEPRAARAARRARELSYGQLRRALVARAFVAPRRLYLLDEPFDGLDAQARQQLSSRLEVVRQQRRDDRAGNAPSEDVPRVGHRTVCSMRAPDAHRW